MIDNQSESPLRLQNRKWFQRFVVWGLLALGWELLGASLGPERFPRFSDVLISLIAALTNGDLLTLLGSLRQLIVGFGLAAVLGVALGLLIGGSRLVDYLLRIYVNALLVTSLEALLPFLIIMFGTKLPFRIVIVFLFALPPIIISTTTGVRTVNAELLEMAAAFCASRRKIVIGVVLPGALPYILAGLRTGLGSAIKGMVVAELWIVVDTGQRLIDLGTNHSFAEFVALALWIVIIGGLAMRGLSWLQARLAPWNREGANLRGEGR